MRDFFQPPYTIGHIVSLGFFPKFLDNSCLITHSFDFCDFEIERFIETLNMKMLYTYMFFHMFYAYLDNGQTFALRGLI